MVIFYGQVICARPYRVRAWEVARKGNPPSMRCGNEVVEAVRHQHNCG